MPPSFSLAGKVAFVTGASYGIGEGLSRSLADAGARVAVGARSMTSCRNVAPSICGIRMSETTTEMSLMSPSFCRASWINCSVSLSSALVALGALLADLAAAVADPRQRDA